MCVRTTSIHLFLTENGCHFKWVCRAKLSAEQGRDRGKGSIWESGEVSWARSWTQRSSETAAEGTWCCSWWAEGSNSFAHCKLCLKNSVTRSLNLNIIIIVFACVFGYLLRMWPCPLPFWPKVQSFLSAPRYTNQSSHLSYKSYILTVYISRNKNMKFDVIRCGFCGAKML